MLYTSGFVNDIMFSYNGGNKRGHVGPMFRQVR